MICSKCGSAIVEVQGNHICVACYNDYNPKDSEICKYCGADIYYGQHVCKEELQDVKATLQKSANALWDTITDILDQCDIVRLESLHRKDLENLGII